MEQCRHRVVNGLAKAIKPPFIHCKCCWFRLFDARPGLVLAMISLTNFLSNLKKDQLDESTITYMEKCITKAMGTTFRKYFIMYYNEVFKEKYRNN